MVRTLLLALLASIFVLPAASAQTSVYVTYTDVDFNFFGNTFPVSETTSNRNGVGVGITYDFLTEGRFAASVDVRGSVNPGPQVGGGTGSVNIKVGFNPRKIWLKPYFQLGLGVAHAHVTSYYGVNGQSTGPVQLNATNVGLNLDLGLDIRITHGFDLRLLEAGGEAPFSQGNGSNFTVGAGSASIGVVYHLPSHVKTTP